MYAVALALHDDEDRYLARCLCNFLLYCLRLNTMATRKTRIVCISDSHNQTPKLPKGDVLIHAGDLTNQGSVSELRKTVEWLEKAEFDAKIVVAGIQPA